MNKSKEIYYVPMIIEDYGQKPEMALFLFYTKALKSRDWRPQAREVFTG